MAVRYTRRFAPNDYGPDVEAVARALCRAGHGPRLSTFNALPERVRRRWGWRKRRWLRSFKGKHGLPADGIYGKGAHAALSPYFDARARELMAQFEPDLELVEPRQGWGSLDRSLWGLYSLGRNWGCTDLGTYNSASRLPGGGVSDHAKGPPALAFDAGSPDNPGAGDPGDKLFARAVGDRRVEYVIWRNQIWSQSLGLHAYTAGGHFKHVHVSGRHSLLVRASLRVQELAERALA